MATVNPTRMELQKTKKRLVTAQRGHKLLKDKQDEMARQFMIYIRRNRTLRREIEELLGKAMGEMSLAEAQMGTAALEEALMISAAAEPPVFSAGNIMSIGFEKAYALQTDLNMNTSEIISTYVYKKCLLDGDYCFSTAVGLFNTVINVILLVTVNKIVARMNEGKGL